jgi:hypothetical protein
MLEYGRILTRRFSSLFRKRSLDEDLDQELRSHVELATEANLRQGMSPKTARTEALRSFGGIELTKEIYREQRGVPMIETLLQDIRYALRVLAKSPGFTAAAVLSLSLGIGVNTLVFSAVNAVVLRPLPYADSGQLVWVARYAPAFRSENAGAADYQDWSGQPHVFQGVAAYANVSSNLGGAGTEPVHIVGARVSASLFDVLKIKPWMGRPILASDDRPGAPGVAVLTHELFDGAFRGDAHVLGTSITVDGEPFTVIGVLPPGFRFPDPAGADQC